MTTSAHSNERTSRHTAVQSKPQPGGKPASRPRAEAPNLPSGDAAREIAQLSTRLRMPFRLNEIPDSAVMAVDNSVDKWR